MPDAPRTNPSERQVRSVGSWTTEYTWTYSWDTEDRLTKVEKYDEVEETYDVCVEYKYCPSCGGALSERIEYESDRSTVKSWLRYQYHGLNLLRIDERYDSDNDNVIESTDLWRVMNWYIHGPGSMGQTVRATAYSYNHNKTNSPCQTDEYYYCYDALGNVNGVLQDGTYYRWETDAFGNDLPGGNDCLPMTSEGPKEHQTGKMYDTATGLYYFHARWYDPEVGRFLGRDKVKYCLLFYEPYAYVQNNPAVYFDPDGNFKTRTDARCCTKKQIDQLERSTILACAKVKSKVTKLNPLLGGCIEEHCMNDTIECRTDCPKPSCAYVTIKRYRWQDDPVVGEAVRHKDIVVCPNLTSNSGAMAIHEWGHACGCLHDRPDNYYGENIDDYKTGPCKMLPRYCNTEYRGF